MLNGFFLKKITKVVFLFSIFSILASSSSLFSMKRRRDDRGDEKKEFDQDYRATRPRIVGPGQQNVNNFMIPSLRTAFPKINFQNEGIMLPPILLPNYYQAHNMPAQIRKVYSFDEEQKNLFKAIEEKNYNEMKNILESHDKEYNKKLINKKFGKKGRVKVSLFQKSISMYVRSKKTMREREFFPLLYKMIELLLKNGADVEDVYRGELVLQRVLNTWGCISSEYPDEKYKNILQLFLDYGADINKGAGDLNFTALHSAIIYNHFDVFKFLVERGANLDVIDVRGRSLFSFALEKSFDFRGIKFFLNNGESIYSLNGNSSTDLYAFCSLFSWRPSLKDKDIVECIKFLVGDGRYINRKEYCISVRKSFLSGIHEETSLVSWLCQSKVFKLPVIIEGAKFLVDMGANLNIEFIKMGNDGNEVLISHFDLFLRLFREQDLRFRSSLAKVLRFLFMHGAHVDWAKLSLEECNILLKDGGEEIREQHDIFIQNKGLLDDGIENKKVEDVKSAIKELKKSLLRDCISPYDRLMTLSKMVKVSKIFGENFISKSEIFDVYLKRIPFNYDFFHNDNCKDLYSFVINNYAEAKDLFGRSFKEASCNYPELVINLFKRKPRAFFTDDVNDIGTDKQIKPLLKYLILGYLKNKDEQKNIERIIDNNQDLKKVREKLVPSTTFHKYFMNMATVYSLLQGVLGVDLPNKVISFLPSANVFGDKSYLPAEKLMFDNKDDMQDEELEDE